jgi:anti-anti-sigma factor
MPDDSTTSTDLVIDITAGADRVDVTIRGELDAHSSVQFEQAASGALDAQVELQTMVLDLGGITFIDSSGLRSLLRLQESCDERGGVLFVRRPSDVVSRIIDLAKLGGRFPTEPA